MVRRLALHETLETHELLTFKNVALTKSTLMEHLAQDEELKNILNHEVVTGRQAVERLQHFLDDGGTKADE